MWNVVTFKLRMGRRQTGGERERERYRYSVPTSTMAVVWRFPVKTPDT